MRPSLAFLIAAALLPWADPAQAQERAFSCREGLNTYLSATTVTQENPLLLSTRGPVKKLSVSVPIAEDALFLKYGFSRKINKLTEAHRHACLDLAATTYQTLLEFAQQRLASLLEGRDYQGFYTEMGNWLSPRAAKAQREEAIQNLIGNFEPAYLQLVKSALFTELQGTPWAQYGSLHAEVDTWTQEWSGLTGREAPAAVYFEKARIALRPLDYDPAELKVFLFHELSHLADPHFNATNLFQNEVYAWTQTVAYLEALKSERKPVPSFFQGVLQGIQLLGLEQWVRLVFDEHTHRQALRP